MKTYGVNGFLVWVGLLVFMVPLYAWLDLFLFSHWHSPPDPRGSAVAQAFGLTFFWIFLFYKGYGNTLSDPKAVERLRQKLQRGKSTRRYRWPIMWTTALAVVGTVSTVCRLIFGQPSWLHIIGYSLLLPCTCLISLWLIEKATEKGEMAHFIKRGPEKAP